MDLITAGFATLSTAVGQVAYAFAPALAGVIHDAADGYGVVLALCAGLQLLAAALVLPSRLFAGPAAR